MFRPFNFGFDFAHMCELWEPEMHFPVVLLVLQGIALFSSIVVVCVGLAAHALYVPFSGPFMVFRCMRAHAARVLVALALCLYAYLCRWVEPSVCILAHAVACACFWAPERLFMGLTEEFRLTVNFLELLWRGGPSLYCGMIRMATGQSHQIPAWMDHQMTPIFPLLSRVPCTPEADTCELPGLTTIESDSDDDSGNDDQCVPALVAPAAPAPVAIASGFQRRVAKYGASDRLFATDRLGALPQGVIAIVVTLTLGDVTLPQVYANRKILWARGCVETQISGAYAVYCLTMNFLEVYAICSLRGLEVEVFFTLPAALSYPERPLERAVSFLFTETDQCPRWIIDN